jgi:uncharacterized protein YoxC
MTALLIVLSIAEIAAVLAVLVGYLIAVARSLRRTSATLGKVAFGVRAIETQTQTIGATVPPINERLRGVAGALTGLAALANAKAGHPNGRR